MIIPEVFLQEAGEAFIPHLFNVLKAYTSIKVNFELCAEYFLVKKSLECVEVKSLQSKMEAFTVNSDIHELYKEHVLKINSRMEDFQEKDSGWAKTHIFRLEMNVNKYKPIKGSSHIALPKSLASKKAIVNVKNNDEYCVKRTVIAAIMGKEKNAKDVHHMM